jgi:hypothetical protein
MRRFVEGVDRGQTDMPVRLADFRCWTQTGSDAGFLKGRTEHGG